MTLITPIVQFGTSRFLQAHVDLFVSEALEQGKAAGPITVVQSSGSSARSERLRALATGEGYPVIIRGLEDGQTIERTVRAQSIRRGLEAARDWRELRRIVVEEARFIVSNTGDAGFAVPTDERIGEDSQAVPSSFPAKLTALLAARWRTGRPGLTIMPCELIVQNGAVLHGLVRALAVRSAMSSAFVAWLDEACIWADSLVDRIVSAPIEPAGAIAEPYALWAIERRPGLELPCTHPAIKLVDRLEPFERLKLHILNLGHTVLAEIWQVETRPATLTVREMLADPAIARHLHHLYDEEVIPGFAGHGMGEEARSYVNVTLERFANPFLDHRLSDIADNHRQKVERRIKAFLDWAEMSDRRPRPLLQAVIAAH